MSWRPVTKPIWGCETRGQAGAGRKCWIWDGGRGETGSCGAVDERRVRSERRGSDSRMLLNIRDEMCRITGHFADVSVCAARAMGLEKTSAKLAEEEGRSWAQSVEEAETSKHYGHDFILSSSTIAYPSLKFGVCLQYCCSIATLLASQPKDIPLTLMALKRFVNRCHYTHNEPMVQSNWAHIYQSPTKSTWST